VSVTLDDPALASSNPAFIADPQVGPATSQCSVAGNFTVGSTVPFGHYRLTLSGPNHLGLIVTARVEFDVVDQVGVTPTSTSVPPGVPTPTATATRVTQQGPPAPVVIQQTLNLTGGPPVPIVGQTNNYTHVISVTNTSPR